MFLFLFLFFRKQGNPFYHNLEKKMFYVLPLSHYSGTDITRPKVWSCDSSRINLPECILERPKTFKVDITKRDPKLFYQLDKLYHSRAFDTVIN